MSRHKIAVLGALAALSVLAVQTAPAEARYQVRVLKRGMHGSDVKLLQLYLTRAGFATPADGAFGPGTRAMLIGWERFRSRRVDGVATRRDQKALRMFARARMRNLHAGRHPSRRARRPSARPAPRGGRVRSWIDRRGYAHVSANAPYAVRKLIGAGNHIAKKPYRYGGGHASFRDSGYDCSGSASYALKSAGLLRGGARPSGGFRRWGLPGRGRWITVYAHGGHMFIRVAGLRFDTTDRERDGTRWHRDMRSTAGYAVRHPGRL